MGKRFKVGRSYEATDQSYGLITVTGRTAQFIKVVNEYGIEWRMKIRTDSDGEYAFDSTVGRKWSDAFTYRAKWEV